MERRFPAYNGDEPYVFVCYAHEDADIVYAEIARLHENGVNVWYDEGIAPGQEWTQELADAIEGASHTLFFVSPISVTSRNCRNEIQYALARGKRVVTVHLEPTELPGGLQLSIGLDQAILKHAMSDDEFQRKVASALGTAAPAQSRPEADRPARHLRSPLVIALAAILIAVAAAAVWWAGEVNGTKRKPTVAVLPFENLSNNPAEEYFSDGIAEDILQGLARNPALEVRARASSFSFKNKDLDIATIADQLGVTYVVNGSVRKVGDDVRVVTRLTDATNQIDVWNDQYDRDLVDVFAVMDDITASVLDRLNVHFAGTPRRQRDPEAYTAYLQGRFYLNRLDIRKAIAHLERAVAIDQSDADAYAALAQIWAIADYMGLANPEERDLVEHFAGKALAIDPDQANASGLATRRLKVGDAIAALDRLIRQYPNNPELHYYYSAKLRQIGRSDLEIAVLTHRTKIDPLSPIAFQQLGYAHQFAGRYEAARVQYVKAEQLGLPLPFYLSLIALDTGDLAALESQLARPLSDWPNAAWRDLFAAEALRARGNLDQMEAALAALESSKLAERAPDLPYTLRWWVAMMRGDIELALEHYRSALIHGEEAAEDDIQGSHGTRLRNPAFFSHPGYAAMLVEFGFDPATLSTIAVPALPFPVR